MNKMERIVVCCVTKIKIKANFRKIGFSQNLNYSIIWSVKANDYACFNTNILVNTNARKEKTQKSQRLSPEIV